MALRGHLLLLLCLLTLAVPVSARADEIKDIRKLVEDHQLPAALTRLDAYLDTHPKDPQALFLKGLVFTEQKKHVDAIRIFQTLTEDYPGLPEPFNNLAVLYAEQGMYPKARDALLQAIKTHPTYATAQENLGDIYAKMASEAYRDALRLNTTNPVAMAKLALVRTLFVAGTANEREQEQSRKSLAQARAEAQSQVRAESMAKLRAEALEQVRAEVLEQVRAEMMGKVKAEVMAQVRAEEMTRLQGEAQAQFQAQERERAEAQAREREQLEAQARERLAAQAAQAREERLRAGLPRAAEEQRRLAALAEAEQRSTPPATTSQPSPPLAALAPERAVQSPQELLAAARTAPVAPEESTESPSPAAAVAAPQAVPDNARQEVETAVRGWARAWAERNHRQYLASYDPDFQLPQGFAKRKEWESRRRGLISRSRGVRVQVESLQVEILAPDLATATFVQRYTSENYKDVVTKTLHLKRRGGRWMILRELSNG